MNILRSYKKHYMKIQQIVLSVILIISSGISYAQISGFGIQSKLNISRHHYNNPLQPKHGISATENLLSFGADIYGDYKFTNAWTLRLKVGYERKGFSGFEYQTIGENLFEPKYKFDYISTDILINYHLIQLDPLLKIYPIAGFSIGYLFNLNAPTTIFDLPPYDQSLQYFNYDNYSNINLSAILGIGIFVKDIIWAEVELNKDLMSPIKTESLSVRNRVISYNVGINLLQLFKK